MKFTEEQFKALSAYEQKFHTAIIADWCRHPGLSGLRLIYDIYTTVTGDQRRFSDNCQHCIVSLMRDCGRLYFADKEEIMTREAAIAAENDKKAVELSEQAAGTKEKVEVKTAKKPRKKAAKK